MGDFWDEISSWLTDPELVSSTRTMLLAGIAIAVMCSALSVIVVLKRLAFVGQGISHSAFGGVGLAAALGYVVSGKAELSFYGETIVFAFAIVAGLVIGSKRVRGANSVDTVIGVVLVASMAIGFLLLRIGSEQGHAVSTDSVLFGQLLVISRQQALVTALAVVPVCGVLWVMRRRIALWVFDESYAEDLGMRTGVVRAIIMVLLAVTIILAMRLVGAVLVTALLVLPGAAALNIARRAVTAVVLSLVIGVVGVVGGMFIGLGANLQLGPAVVVVLVAAYALSLIGVRRG